MWEGHRAREAWLVGKSESVVSKFLKKFHRTGCEERQRNFLCWLCTTVSRLWEISLHSSIVWLWVRRNVASGQFNSSFILWDIDGKSSGKHGGSWGEQKTKEKLVQKQIVLNCDKSVESRIFSDETMIKLMEYGKVTLWKKWQRCGNQSVSVMFVTLQPVVWVLWHAAGFHIVEWDHWLSLKVIWTLKNVLKCWSSIWSSFHKLFGSSHWIL